MRTVDQARELAAMMAAIGDQAGKPTSVLITDMNQPLGLAVGNALEVEEAIKVLRGEVTGDLKRVALALAAEMLVAAGLSESIDRAEARLEEALSSGEALQRLQRMIELLGGDPRVCQDSALLPRAAETVRLEADRAGYLCRIDTMAIGQAAQLLGAGRATKADAIDPAVGLKMKVRLGDRIEAGMQVAELHVNRREHLEEAIGKVRTSLAIDEQIPRASELIYDRIRSGEG
jgi:thymidine phosphorylase